LRRLQGEGGEGARMAIADHRNGQPCTNYYKRMEKRGSGRGSLRRAMTCSGPRGHLSVSARLKRAHEGNGIGGWKWLERRKKGRPAFDLWPNRPHKRVRGGTPLANEYKKERGPPGFCGPSTATIHQKSRSCSGNGSNAKVHG